MAFPECFIEQPPAAQILSKAPLIRSLEVGVASELRKRSQAGYYIGASADAIRESFTRRPVRLLLRCSFTAVLLFQKLHSASGLLIHSTEATE